MLFTHLYAVCMCLLDARHVSVQAVNKLLNFVQDEIDKIYDRFELYCLTNLLKVPPHIELPTDLPKDTCTPEREAALKVTVLTSINLLADPFSCCLRACIHKLFILFHTTM